LTGGLKVERDLMILGTIVRTNSASQGERSPSDDRKYVLGVAIGIAFSNTKVADEDLSSEGTRLGRFAGAAVRAFP
jgi:hypothetical protein